VLQHVQIEHEQRVVAGGFEERVIPLEGGEALRGAFMVEGLEELALRVIHLDLRARTERKEEEKCGRKENSLTSDHGSGEKSRISRCRKENSKVFVPVIRNSQFLLAARRNLEFLILVKISRERERR
jgi:hypothetical protein